MIYLFYYYTLLIILIADEVECDLCISNKRSVWPDYYINNSYILSGSNIWVLRWILKLSWNDHVLRLSLQL